MSTKPETESVFNPDRQEGHRAQPIGPEDGFDNSIADAYDKGDRKGAYALEQAQRFLQDNPDAPNKYGFAQRAMESMLKSGEWSDVMRQAAVDMNTAQRIADGRSSVTTEASFQEMGEYAKTWRDATLENGAKDEWLNQEGLSLGYWVKNAERGSVEGVDYMLRAVESLLAHSGTLTEQERGAQELRDLRDTLFAEKQRLQAEADKQRERTASQERQKAQVADAREVVAKVFEDSSADLQQPKEKPEETLEQRLARKQQEFDALPPEEKEFRFSLAGVKTDLHIAALADIGLGREVFGALSGPQKERLTQLFKDVRREKLGVNGEAAVAELQGRLEAGVAQIVGADTVKEQAGVDELDRVESPAATAEPESNQETALGVEEPQKNLSAKESTERRGTTEQTIDMRRTGINFANAYLKNPMTARWITEQGVDLGGLAKRMETGDFRVSDETVRRMKRLASETRPQSDVWNTAFGVSSMLGRAATEARNELLGIIRSM